MRVQTSIYRETPDGAEIEILISAFVRAPEKPTCNCPGDDGEMDIDSITTVDGESMELTPQELQQAEQAAWDAFQLDVEAAEAAAEEAAEETHKQWAME
jgi:hypothetical protein